jgi:hypothetical protein
MLPEGQAVRALRVSPGLPGHSKYSTLDGQDLLGCLHENVWLQDFQNNTALPTLVQSGYKPPLQPEAMPVHLPHFSHRA